eukprot:100385-Chlamydomonas_euryale.AAC.16
MRTVGKRRNILQVGLWLGASRACMCICMHVVAETIAHACTLAGYQRDAICLQILSTNTRRTKVVELSSGTHRLVGIDLCSSKQTCLAASTHATSTMNLRHHHIIPQLIAPLFVNRCRVPEELKKHYLSDGQNGQYSTNLDRNRYGNDDNYLFTGKSKR